MNPVPCGVFTGILFSRKRCNELAAVTCGRCKVALCKKHLVPQDTGPFLCPRCDRYANDNEHDWDYDERRGGWRWSGSRTNDNDARPVAAAGGAVAAKPATPPLDDDDKPGFDKSTWHGGESSPGEAGEADDDIGAQESDFDDS